MTGWTLEPGPYEEPAPTETLECPICRKLVPLYLFGPSSDRGGSCPYCDEPLAESEDQEPFEKIEVEDVLAPRVVRHQQDVVIVLDNPRVGRAEYPHDRPPEEGERPKFAVTARKGFQCYLETMVVENPDDPDGEPVFRGTTHHHKNPTPEYRLKVTL